MSTDREPSGGMFGVLAAGIGLCCGLPLLLGAGIAIGATGYVVGSGLLIAAGVAVAVWAWHRRQRAACHPDVEQRPDAHEHDQP